jgi:hypothetical protein
MKTKEPPFEMAAIRERQETIANPTSPKEMPTFKTHVPRECRDCKVENAFTAWRSEEIGPSFNTLISFNPAWGIPPAGKRAVIELVTATINVPAGERARLRMFTSIGSTPSNLDFVLTSQGQVGGKESLMCTHSIRAYSDNLVEFNVNRDNAQTKGYAFICISGYYVDM